MKKKTKVAHDTFPSTACCPPPVWWGARCYNKLVCPISSIHVAGTGSDDSLVLGRYRVARARTLLLVRRYVLHASRFVYRYSRFSRSLFGVSLRFPIKTRTNIFRFAFPRGSTHATRFGYTHRTTTATTKTIEPDEKVGRTFCNENVSRGLIINPPR